jgi:hypothetical protein
VIYAVGIFGICFVSLFCFRFDRVMGEAMFAVYRAFGLARDRSSFTAAYRLFLRAVGVVMIVGIVVLLSLHAFG